MLKVTPQIYILAVEKGYPEVLVSIEGITVPANDSAEEIEKWILEKKSIICRPYAKTRNLFQVEVRVLGTESVLAILSEKRSYFSYDKARLMCIEKALNLI